jgi:hypothetical protein
MKINETIFDKLSTIWSEKLHSQMIVWLIELLKEEEKKDEINILINWLFWFNRNTKHTIEDIWTEIKNIDVYIKTENNILIIENKIKSSEHSNQTEKYITILKENEENNTFGCFLTLIWEDAESELDIWKNKSYLDLYNIISDFNINNQYFKDYLLTLCNLINTLDSFLANHTQYLDIFKNWSLTKKDKLNKTIYKGKNEIFKYITIYQLETIYQKAFLHKIIKKVSSLKKYNEYFITETHWTAIIQIYYNKKKFHETDIWKYYLWFQIQWNTLKYNLSSDDYYKSSSVEITKKLQKDFINSFKEDDFTINPLRTKAYISVSKKIDLYEKSIDEIVSFFDTEINKFNTLCNNHFKNEF